MRYIKKTLIIILLLILFAIPIKTNATSEYKEKTVELRGAWVSTVSNLDVQQQLSIDQFQKQYLNILSNFEKFHMNAVIFQVRPTNDAFYESDINPWSTFLTGKQGQDPGWDPLPWMIEETHKRGMEFHAWLNPYRVTLDVFSSENLSTAQYQSELNTALQNLDNKNFAKKHPDLLIQGGKRILLNPGKPAVREHIYDTIEEIITKYDVDAIHFDDYFYNEVALSRDRELYMQDSKAKSYDTRGHQDWRRLQVDLLIQGINELIDDFNNQNNCHVQFGISPAAGWAPSSKECPAYPNGYGMEDGMEGFPCNGYSSYIDLYADTRKWVKEEWIDYIVPQNYFELGRYHEVISTWWNRQVEGTKVKLYMGLPMHIVSKDNIPATEITDELAFNQQFTNISGYVLFSYKNLVQLNNKLEVATNELKKYWTKKSILPIGLVSGDASETKAENLQVTRKNNKIELRFTTDDNAIGYLLYRFPLDAVPDIDDDNYYDTITVFNRNEVTYFDTVNNNSLYKYYLKAVLKNGNISNWTTSIEVKDLFINRAPKIEKVKLSNVIFNVNETLNIKADLIDADGDDLTVTIEYTTDGERYRYKTELIISNNKLDYNFVLPRQITNNGKFKITIFDGNDSDVYYSDVVYVVEAMGDLQKQMYYAQMRLDNLIKQIWSK